MVLPVNIQIYYFLSTLCAGFLTGIFFDIYRVIRGFNNPNKVITAISDILFWILAGIVTFTFFLYSNNGEIGYYTFIGLLMGVIIYFLLLSIFFIRVLTIFVYFVFKVFRLLTILIIYPIKSIRYVLRYICYKFKTFLVSSKYNMKTKLNSIKNKNIKKEKENL